MLKAKHLPRITGLQIKWTTSSFFQLGLSFRDDGKPAIITENHIFWCDEDPVKLGTGFCRKQKLPSRIEIIK